MDELHGADVLTSLAKIYQQLYIAPGNDNADKYADVVKKGHDIEDGDLSHFIMDTRDSLVYEDTPAGMVCVITLYNRADFVTFLRIMANRCTMAGIPDTQGASIIDGVANWAKIREHKEAFISGERMKGNPFPDWKAEFARFTSDKSNYLDTLIVLSVGPYSGIITETVNGYFRSRGRLDKSDDAEDARSEITGDEWLSLSDTIRRYHECTHFICRNRFPDKKDAVWDELVADAVGIFAAFGGYDHGLGELFLGIEDGRYTGGRLENYIKTDTGDERWEEEKKRLLEELAMKTTPVLKRFEELIDVNRDMTPFDIAILLEERKERLWDDI